MATVKIDYRTEEGRKLFRNKVLYAAAKCFLEHGYTNTSNKTIAECAGVHCGSMTQHFGTKENILCELVEYVLKSQFEFTENMLNGITDDKILIYAAETTLQLNMAESSEQVRDLYAAAYSMPKSSAIIQQMITEKLEVIFGQLHPDLDTKEFYKLEIASGGIMRGFMTIPCNMWFTMDQKVAAFIETTFRVYSVPDEKIKQTVEFVSRFDFKEIAHKVINGMLAKLENMEASIE